MSIAAHVPSGKIPHADLESAIGRLSFAQTSVFGRIGRAMLSPLYVKLHSNNWDATIDLKELTTLRWWVASLGHMKPRKAIPKHAATERVVYTDAAGKSAIMADVVFDPSRFTAYKTIGGVWSLKTGFRWKSTFAKTNFIYGLEMVALLALLMDESNDIRDKSATFYIDNDNALQALVKMPPDPRLSRAWWPSSGTGYVTSESIHGLKEYPRRGILLTPHEGGDHPIPSLDIPNS